MAAGNLARALAAVLVMLLAALALPVTSAFATEPVVTIEEPQDGSSTNSLTPLLAGSTSDPFAGTVTVKVYAGSEAGETPVQSAGVLPLIEGHWEVTAEALSQGVYTAVAEQTDQAALPPETGKSEEVTFTVDTTKPDVSLNIVPSPANNASPTLTGEGGEETGDAPEVELKLYSGTHVSAGSLLATTDVPVSGGGWSQSLSALTDGTYTAQATQGDKAGNIGASSPVTFTIDTTKPLLSASEVPATTKDPTPTLGGAAGTASGDQPTVAVAIRQGASVLRTASVPVVAGKWSYTPSPQLADGSYTVAVSQEDEAHNLGEAEAAFTVDTVKPVVSVNSVPSPTKNPAPALGGAAGTAGGDLASVTVTIKQGASVLRSADVPVSGGNWSYTPSPQLADGSYTVAVSQEDEAHNVGEAEAAFTVDTVKPAVSASEVPASTNDSTPTLGGAAGTASGDQPTVAVTIEQGASVVRSANVPVVAGRWSYTATELPDGSYTVVVSQEDEAHNAGEAEAAFTVDTVKPAVSTSEVPALTNNSTPTLGSAAGTASGDQPNVAVTIRHGASVLQTASVPVVAGRWSYTATKLADGSYTVTVSQKDEAHNIGEAEAPFTVDTVKPAVSASEVPASTNHSTPTLGGAAGTASGDQPTVAVTIEQGASVLQTASVPVVAGRWSYTAAKLADAAYTVVASQKDEAHNVGEAKAAFTVDTVKPVVSVNPLSSPTNDSTPTVGGAAGTASGDQPTVAVAIRQGATTLQTASVPVVAGKWSYTATELADAAYTVVASQEDEAHNVGEAKAAFTVDTVKPVVSVNPVPSPTKNPAPALGGAAGTASGDQPTVAVAIRQGASVLRTASVPVVAGKWSYTPSPPLANGSYTVVVAQEGEAHNVGEAEAAFVVDTELPVLSVTSPGIGAKVRVADPEISGKAQAGSGHNPQITVNIYRGAAPSGIPEVAHAVAEGESWTTGLTPEELENGQYTVQAEQEDKAGNVGKSPPVTFTIETRLSLEPSVFVTRAGAKMTDATPSFDGTAARSGGNHPVTVRIQSLAPGSTGDVADVLATLVRAHWTAGVSEPLLDGNYKLLVEQSGEGVIEESFTVDADAPLVTLSSPADGSSTAAGSQTAAGSAGSAPGDVAQVTANLYAGASASGAALQSVTVPSGPGGSWATTFGNLSPGTYTVRAEQRDDVGNVGTSQPATFTVPGGISPAAAARPVPPIASFEWVPAAPHTGEPITLVSTSSDADSPLAVFAWSLTANNLFNAGPPVLVTSFATPGVHAVQLSVTDALGLSSVVTEKIGVTTPAVKLMQPFPVVRIAGTQHPRSVKVSLLSVLAPVGADVSITCRGHGCPARSQNVLATAGANKNKAGTVLITLRRFERSLPAGVVLEIKVSGRGVIGKFTRFAVRRGKLPSRLDSCLNLAGTAPIACPS